MSYAGPSRGSAASSRATRSTIAGRGRTTGDSAPSRYPVSEPTLHAQSDWPDAALFGAGLVLGVILGAGGALLTAPRTGAETRAVIGARASRLRRSTARRSQDAWEDLRDELRQAKRALRNRKRRKQEAEL